MSIYTKLFERRGKKLLKLKHFLKPFIYGLLLAIALLFVQAYCDLSLPNYMSNIVNVGIQQNGIESGVPNAISVDAYQLLQIFMTQDDIALVDDSYTLSKATDYKAQYPKAVDELYLLNSDISAQDKTEIETAFGTAAYTMITTIQTLSNLGGSDMQGSGGMMNIADADFSQIYTMLPMFSQLSEEMIEEARDTAVSMGDSMLSQVSVSVVALFYNELGVDMAKIQFNYMVKTGSMMLLFAVISGIATILVGLIASQISTGAARNIRSAIFNKVESFSSTEYDKFSTSSLITRSTNDVAQIQMMLMLGIRMVFFAPIMGIGGIFMALQESVSMSWIIALSVIILIGIILIIFSVALPKFKIMQELVDRLNLVARETLNGLMVIRAFGTRRFEKERFDKANKDLTDTNLFVNRVMVFMLPIMMLIMNGISLLVIWVGSHEVANATMQVGDMMAFMQYAMQIIMSFLMLSMMFIFIPRASVSGDRIAEVLFCTPSINDPLKPILPKNKMRGHLEFKNVHFRYNGAEDDALSDISFTASPGKTTAFIGATGSGKTTLLNLIPRFYDVESGSVLVNGVDVKNMTQQELRSHIGLVPQKSVLMHASIAQNVGYGIDSTDTRQLLSAIEVAQASAFVEEKTEGLDFEIAQGGANVSGGQRQRLSIARALAIKPDIYLFDDSFSALDFKTDAALRGALKPYAKDATVLIVAQRVSTILDADCIFVIDEGKIVGCGTHKELLLNCEEYKEIASSQLSEEELSK